MSSNRLTYDTCAYDQKLKESCDMLSHIIYEPKYENKKNCSFKTAKVGQSMAERVEIESGLRNLDTKYSLCDKNEKKRCSKNDPKCHSGETVNPYLCERELGKTRLPNGTFKCSK